MSRSLGPRMGTSLLACVLLLAASTARAQFDTPPMLPVPGLPTKTAAAAGNFNGDGLLDLTVGYEGGVAVFLGTGPGTYGPALLHPGLPWNWKQVVATDLDSDGLTDLVIANGAVALLFADGSGGFTVVPMNPGADGIYYDFNGVGLGDANLDGHADLLASAHEQMGGLWVYVSLGDGAGNFGAWTSYVVGFFDAGQIAVADVNGDGAADALIANDDANGLKVALNDGNGGFASGPLVPTGAHPKGIALADFDGDGKSDLAVANGGSATLSILKGDGAGGFVVTHTYPGPADSTSVVTADFDGDGLLDLGVGGLSAWTYLGNGAGAFGAPGRYVAAGLPWVADLDVDGRPDLLAGSSEVFNLGGGLFAAPRQFAAGSQPRALAVADMNGEGLPDIVTANAGSNDISVLYGFGNGAFANPVSYAVGSEPRSVAVGDFNGDGRKDVAVANRLSGDVSILLGTATGGLGAATSLPRAASPWPWPQATSTRTASWTCWWLARRRMPRRCSSDWGRALS